MENVAFSEPPMMELIEGKVFMMSGETQDVITDTTDAQYTEFNADEYEAIEEVN